ncbi:MAG TPA: hypothetical protein VFS43_30705 [Polyangiaceae bacterium]|nr:hypothetical protein [Polyangiaceae bacterium]
MGVPLSRLRERYLEVDGVRARVLEAGEGPTIVILASPVIQAAS